MNLEQIDTSTTASKAEVMRLAAEGREVVCRALGDAQWLKHRSPQWNWESVQYAIIAAPVVPDEVWVAVGIADGTFTREGAEVVATARPGTTVVRYIRADLAGEGK